MFEEVVRFFGGKRKLSVALGVTPSAITAWKNQGFFPPGRAVQIERETRGWFKAMQLIEGEESNDNNGGRG